MFLFILKDTGNLELVHESVHVSGRWERGDARMKAEIKKISTLNNKK